MRRAYRRPGSMRRSIVTGLAFLLAATLSARAMDCPQFFAGGVAPRLLNPKLAARTTGLCNDAYAVMASGVTHGALWSAEHPSRASLEMAHGTRRLNTFHPEDRLPEADQAVLADYVRSGYDRGHMTPSGDMPGAAAQQQSFSLANMVPQTPELNRGVWEGIESAIRRLADHDGELYIVTGPAFRGDRIDSIGPDGVLVPTSTWKAVFDPGSNQAGVYVCKNTALPTCVVVSVATLIRVVGIDPFPAVSDRVKQVVMVLPPEDPPDRPRRHRHRHRRAGHEPDS